MELTSNLVSRTDAGVDNTPLIPSSGIFQSFTYTAGHVIMTKWLTQHSQYNPRIQYISGYHQRAKNQNQLQTLVIQILDYRLLYGFLELPWWPEICGKVENRPALPIGNTAILPVPADKGTP